MSTSLASPLIRDARRALPRKLPGGRVRIRHVHVAGPDGTARGIRIAFLTDVHRSRHFSRDHLDALVEAVSALEPDLLVLGGDLINAEEVQPHLLAQVLHAFARVPDPCCRVVVSGNHDIAVGGRPILEDAERWGFAYLENRSVPVEGSGLRVAGVGDMDSGLAHYEDAMEQCEPRRTIAVSHHPDVFADTCPLPFLALAGHLHGGQVRLPLMGPLCRKSRHPEWFDRGWSGRPDSRIYVSSGVGVSRMPLRVGCPPEIVCIDVHAGG